MTISLTARLALAGALIVVAAAAAVSLVTGAPGPPRPGRDRAGATLAVNQAQARAMLPAIDAYLDRDAGHLGLGGGLSPRLKPRTFCDARIVEIRPGQAPGSAGLQSAGPLWRVGIVMNCGEFARRGDTLIEGSAGYPGIGEVVALAGRPGRYQVRAMDVGPPYPDQAWVHAHFSPGGAAVILSDQATAPDPARQACRAFGLPPGTRPLASNAEARRPVSYSAASSNS